MKKSTRTKILTVFAIIFIILICFGFYLTDDEPLNPEATQWMTEASKFKENDAYYLLLGISASASDDPITAGKQTYKQYKDKPMLWYPNDKPYEAKENRNLALASRDGSFCDMKKVDCWSYIFANIEKAPDAIQPYSIIKERYLRIIQSKDYHTNLISISALPPYQYLVQGNQIVLLQAIDQANTDPQSAIKSIQMDLGNLRQQLKIADNLIFKMIINAMVIKDIQAITLLEQKYGISSPIPRLSPEEKSLDKPFKYELVYQHNMTPQLSDDLDEQGYFAHWMNRLELRFFYNQNMTTNRMLNHYKFLINLNALNYSAIEEFVNTHKGESSIHIKNFIGSTQTSILRQDLTYMNYYLRMIDTDLKVMLSNEINAQKLNGTIDLTKIQNPYFTNPTHPYWGADGKQVCLDKPKFGAEDTADSKVCLIVKL
jgi:hypothetical protein